MSVGFTEPGWLPITAPIMQGPITIIERRGRSARLAINVSRLSQPIAPRQPEAAAGPYPTARTWQAPAPGWPENVPDTLEGRNGSADAGADDLEPRHDAREGQPTTADGWDRSVMMSLVKVRLSGGAPTASAPPAPLPTLTSENVPLR